MESFYEILYSLKNKERYTTAQVVGGPLEGAHALFCDHRVLYSEKDNAFWNAAAARITADSLGMVINFQGNRVYLERLAEPLHMVICGAGHVSLKLIPIAKMTGFHVTVIDDRKEFADAAQQAGADMAICDGFAHALDGIEGNGGIYYVILTRGHRSDRLCLEKILGKANAYTGMIGSKSRVAKQLADLAACGFDKALLDRVHTPIGLSIGAETPEEIAVSIMAEIIQVKNTAVKTNGFDQKMLRIAADQNAETSSRKKALVTLIEKRGSGPRNVGTKMLVLEDGTICGTIGGGRLEYDMISKALECIQANKNAYCHYEMGLKEAWEEGMACGGSAGFYIDVIRTNQGNVPLTQ